MPTICNAPSQPCSDLPSFQFKNITVSDVSEAISDFPLKHSHGEDGITSHMRPLSSEAISSCLATILNTPLQEGIFPSVGKSAVITPMFQKRTFTKLTTIDLYTR